MAKAVVFSSALAVLVVGAPSFAEAQTECTQRQVAGATQQQASELIDQLVGAQNALRAGDRVSFDLLVGSYASTEEIRLSPRDTFLSLDVANYFMLQSSRSRNGYSLEYELVLWPECRDAQLWALTVVVEPSGPIRRVEMLYRRPHAF